MINIENLGLKDNVEVKYKNDINEKNCVSSYGLKCNIIV